VTDGMIVMSLSASLQQKMAMATDCPCQIALNWYISSHLRVKLHKKRLHKTGPACSSTDFSSCLSLH
jgi:hypothetical protein